MTYISVLVNLHYELHGCGLVQSDGAVQIQILLHPSGTGPADS